MSEVILKVEETPEELDKIREELEEQLDETLEEVHEQIEENNEEVQEQIEENHEDIKEEVKSWLESALQPIAETMNLLATGLVSLSQKVETMMDQSIPLPSEALEEVSENMETNTSVTPPETLSMENPDSLEESAEEKVEEQIQEPIRKVEREIHKL